VTSRSHDHLFPRVHPRPATGWVNDPNGPLHVDGIWHLWYQFRPSTAPIAPVTWGHLTSTDLAHWTQHRVSITPLPGSVDEDGVWSGNTVALEDGRIAAFYSAHQREDRHQPPVRADSADGGLSFGEPRATVAAPATEERVEQLRDPFVWQEPDGTWRMALGQGDEDGRPGIRLAASDDLESWRLVGLIGTADPGTEIDGQLLGSMWECPQVIDIDGRRVILFAAMGDGVGMNPDRSGFGPVLALVGDQGDAGLGDYAVYRIDAGDAFYAPSVYRDGPDGPLVWGWLVESRQDEWWLEADWAGMLSLPRVLSLAPDGRPQLAPAPQLDALRVSELAVDGGAVTVPQAVEFSLPIGSSAVSLVLTTSVGERLAIDIDPGAGEVVVDRSAASADARAAAHPIRLADAELAGSEVRVFLDGSALELFTASGRSASVRVYPTAPPPWDVVVSGAEGAVRAWELG
jgi:beta-fructofuranosidase